MGGNGSETRIRGGHSVCIVFLLLFSQHLSAPNKDKNGEPRGDADHKPLILSQLGTQLRLLPGQATRSAYKSSADLATEWQASLGFCLPRNPSLFSIARHAPVVLRNPVKLENKNKDATSTIFFPLSPVSACACRQESQ